MQQNNKTYKHINRKNSSQAIHPASGIVMDRQI